ncbi:MAG: hypothetical protein ACRDJH_07120 [Thermomicrobiales bacterium]
MFRRPPRWFAVAVVLCSGLSLLLAPVAAQETPGTATVSVEASVVIPTELSITLCDASADFGDGLNYLGTPPMGTTDTIFATTPGNPTQNQGVYYGWTPTCGAGVPFMRVESNVSWQATLCSSESNGSSSLKIATADLRYSTVAATTYEQAQGFGQVKTCDNPSTIVNSLPAGTHNRNYHLYLQVDRSDTQGTFNTTTTWSVTP